MYVLILNFNLNGMTAEQWASEEAPRLAPAFAHLPGMRSKVWLADPATNTYGGIYFWRDVESMEQFLGSDLAVGIRTHPNITNLTARSFEVQEAPTRLTQPELEIVAAAQLA